MSSLANYTHSHNEVTSGCPACDTDNQTDNAHVYVLATIIGSKCDDTEGHQAHSAASWGEVYRDITWYCTQPQTDEPGDGYSTANGGGGWNVMEGGAEGVAWGKANTSFGGVYDPSPWEVNHTEQGSGSESWDTRVDVDEVLHSGDLAKLWVQGRAEVSCGEMDFARYGVAFEEVDVSSWTSSAWKD